MYYLYQMHGALSVMESAGSDKTPELVRQLDAYNKVLQNRLYGSVGMDMDDDEVYEDDEVVEEEVETESVEEEGGEAE